MHRTALVVLVASFVSASALAQVGERAYVANLDSSTVSIVDTATRAVVATLDVPRPIAVAAAPDGSSVYVEGHESSAVFRIDTATGTVAATIPLPAPGAGGIALTPSGDRAYATLWFAGVAVIDVVAGTVTGVIPTGSFPSQVAVTPDGALALVTDQVDRAVVVIDVATDTVVDSIAAGPQAPFGIAVTADGLTACVVNSGVADASLSVIDLASRTVTDSVPLGSRPQCVAVTPDGASAYVAGYDDGSAYVVSLTAGAVADTVLSGAGAYGVAVTPSGSHAWVANQLADTVTVIDAETHAAVATIPVGDGPRGLAIARGASPTDKDQCKKSGWRAFANPSFDNQGECVSFVQRHH